MTFARLYISLIALVPLTFSGSLPHPWNYVGWSALVVVFGVAVHAAWRLTQSNQGPKVERCEHGDDMYLCMVACTGCGHACNIHAPECRDVTQRGWKTKDWYCRCPGFKNYPPLDPPR